MNAAVKIGISIGFIVVGITIMTTGRIHTGLAADYGEERYLIGAIDIFIGVVFLFLDAEEEPKAKACWEMMGLF